MTYHIKKLIYQLRLIWHFGKKDFSYLSHPLFNSNIFSNQIAQKQIVNQYLLMKKAKLLPLPINQVGWRTFSQFDEDGILLYIFSIIGTTNRVAVEIGADAQADFFGFPENNSSNLLVNHDWRGLIIDASAKNIQKIKRFFRNCRNTTYRQPQLLQTFVTAQNINTVLKKAGFTGEIDLFSLDIDGDDYAVFQALEIIHARVIVLECNRSLDKDKPALNQQKNGASLPAMVALAQKKGYRLVALNSFGQNAFFVKKDLGKKYLPTLSLRKAQSLPS